MPDPTKIDLSAGLVPKSSGGIDLSSGLVPKISTPPDPNAPSVQAHDDSGLGNWIDKAKADVTIGGPARTFVGKLLGHGDNSPGGYDSSGHYTPGVSSGVDPHPDNESGHQITNFLDSPLTTAHGATQLSTHPVKGFNEMAQGVGDALSIPLATVNPGFLGAAAPVSAGMTGVSKGLQSLGLDKDYSNAIPNVIALAMGAKQLKSGGVIPEGETSIPAGRSATPSQVEALNSLRPGSSSQENFSSSQTVAPEIRNAAAGMAENEAAANPPNIIKRAIGGAPQLKIKGQGRAGGQKLIQAAQNAIDTHESQVNAVKEPYLNETVDTTPAAYAVRTHITPELQAAAQANPSGPEARTVAQLNDLANQNDGKMSIADADARRHRFNDELNSEYNKSAAAQDVSPTVSQAKRDAAGALRTAFYNRLTDLSGQDVRPLAQREGQLIETKGDLQSRYNSASNSKLNDLSRGQKFARAGMKIDLTRPGTIIRAFPQIKDALTKEGGTPIGDFNKTAQRAVGNLGRSEQTSTYVPEPEYVGEPSGSPQPAGVRDAELPNGNLGLPPGPVRDVPPSANETFHLPALPGAKGVPLHATSDSTVGNNAGNVDVVEGGAHPQSQIPELIRNFVNNKDASTGLSPNLDAYVRNREAFKPVPGNSPIRTNIGNTSQIPSVITRAVSAGQITPTASRFVPGISAEDMAIPGRVNVMSTDGQYGHIPESQLQEAITKWGYRIAPPLAQHRK